MSLTVCVSPTHTLSSADAGGHLWVYLNWALGMRANGCRVIWLEGVEGDVQPETVRSQLDSLKSRLQPYGLADAVALCHWNGQRLPQELREEHLDLDAAAQSDLLVNLRYATPASIVKRFRRSVLVDIDPGLLQTWMASGSLPVAPHDVYFTIGEAVGQPGSRFPDGGVEWHHTFPCVALDWWQYCEADASAERAFTTISHWYAGGWIEERGEAYSNYKRSGFLPFLDLPRNVSKPMELALDLLPEDDYDRNFLLERGWRVSDARTVASTPWEYQRYIQTSLAEFSCAKPVYVRLQTAWISDRTPCYLASGRPAVVQHTGLSRVLPEWDGLFRFRTPDEARRALDTVIADYPRQCRLARQIAEEFFDARKIAAGVLEQALG
jgi:hypothetical protein